MRPGVGVWVIALDDLMMDRLRQAADGSVVTFEAAVSLAATMRERIDWGSLGEEAGSSDIRALGVGEALEAVRAAGDPEATG